MPEAMKVLIAEDDDGIREGLVEIVSESATAIGVSTTEDAARMLGRERFDLVLTDLSLDGAPYASGRRIVDAAARCGTPVALVTGAPRAEVQAALRGVEVAAVLTKPFHIDDILALVDRFHPSRRTAFAG